jgi:bifunctional non-homologous end joining protein LigD
MSKAKLSEYSKKRSFKATPEPAPQASAPADGPLMFVVQQHSARRLHYDFRLECDGVLKSWAVPKGPSLNREDRRLAVQTEDHPYDYASFEGVIPPKQYGAGEVIVWDCGVYSPHEDHGDKHAWFHDRARAEREVRKGLEKGKLSILLRGEKLKGSFALVRTRSAKEWLLIKHRDRYASTEDVTARDRSVLSNVAVEEMKSVPAHRMPASRIAPAGETSPMPKTLSPMHAEIAEAAFNDKDWMWEPKLDGYRVLAFIDEKEVRMVSRNGLDFSKDFPKLGEELKQQAAPMILDGEVVAFDERGRHSFNAMQNRKSGVHVVFYCFDLLYFAGVDLRKLPYRDRRRYLAQCLLPTPLVQLVHADENGEELARAALAAGFEGVIGKKKDSAYHAGKRSSSWVKVKPVQTADFVIGGYTTGKGARAPLGALLVGAWEGGKLKYASHVGSGFDDKTLTRVRKALEPLKTRTNPFSEKPELNAPTTWVEPKLVAELKFHSWTEDGHLRAPVFLRLRDDIEPKEVVRFSPRGVTSESSSNEILRQLESKKDSFTLVVEGHAIKLTHLNREYWPAEPAFKQPALTKRDLLRYLAQVSPYMLPHLADRPFTLIRMPEGIEGERFFQKHWRQAKPSFVQTLSVFSSHNEGAQEVLLCNNLPTLLWLAQNGTLEFHVWHSRAKGGPDTDAKEGPYATEDELDASVLSRPDYVVFDIDPYIYSGKEKKGAEPELNTVAFEKGKEVAFWLKELLNGMKLEPIVKTSGKTGLHVFVPIKRTIDFDAARSVSELVGRHLMRAHPKEITMEWSVPKRTGKIFMDFNMNVRGKTLNVAYSPRGAAGGPISMPLTWKELEKAHPLDFRLENAIERLSQTGDRWSEVLELKQNLEKSLKT